MEYYDYYAQDKMTDFFTTNIFLNNNTPYVVNYSNVYNLIGSLEGVYPHSALPYSTMKLVIGSGKRMGETGSRADLVFHIKGGEVSQGGRPLPDALLKVDVQVYQFKIKIEPRLLARDYDPNAYFKVRYEHFIVLGAVNLYINLDMR